MNTISKANIKEWIPKRDKTVYKNKLGHILFVGGNDKMGGAIILSAAAAVHSGAGLVTVASAPMNVSALHARLPEAMFVNMYDVSDLMDSIKKADVVAIGPGLGLSEESEQIFLAVLDALNPHQWLVMDGDALTHLATNSDTIIIPTENRVITPHLGEWRKLTTLSVKSENPTANMSWRDKHTMNVVLKKDKTEVYLKNESWKNTAGNPSMATGGMGDTLTGILSSFLGQFPDKEKAILSAVYIHSAIADALAETHYVTLPSKIIDQLPVFIKTLEK